MRVIFRGKWGTMFICNFLNSPSLESALLRFHSIVGQCYLKSFGNQSVTMTDVEPKTLYTSKTSQYSRLIFWRYYHEHH